MSQKTKCSNCNEMFANSSYRKHYEFCIKNNTLPLITQIDKKIKNQYDIILDMLDKLNDERINLKSFIDMKNSILFNQASS